MNERAKAILNFWFVESGMKDWFSQNYEFDNKIRTRFSKDLNNAINNEYDEWQDTSEECVALVILLDQFSRNLFRNSSKAFLMDNKARTIARNAIKKKYHKIIPNNQLLFIFLPFMHSEELNDQFYCNELIDNYLKDNPQYKEIKKFSKLHKDIIKKFGRFPYRNKVMKRINTKEEDEYLNSNHYDFFNI